jgi:hypothetical protein
MADDVVVAPEEDEALRWFHSPAEHAAQILVVNLVCLPWCLWLCRRFSQGEAAKSEAELAPRKAPRPLNIFEKIGAVTLLVAWLLNVAHKLLYGPRRMLALLFPCHPISFLVLYALFERGRNFRRASYLWSFTVQCCFLSGIAMALPDTSDIAAQYRWWAVPVFWVHHAVVTALPWVCLLTGAFHVETRQFNAFWFPFAFTAWALYFFNVQQTTSLLFNTVGRHWWTDTQEICNINYMVYPPPVAGAGRRQSLIEGGREGGREKWRGALSSWARLLRLLLLRAAAAACWCSCCMVALYGDLSPSGRTDKLRSIDNWRGVAVRDGAAGETRLLPVTRRCHLFLFCSVVSLPLEYAHASGNRIGGAAVGVVTRGIYISTACSMSVRSACHHQIPALLCLMQTCCKRRGTRST